jgi:hypothetical protein
MSLDEILLRRHQKIEAHARHLLDGFLSLRQRYSFLDPMLFDNEIIAARGSKKQARGFKALTNSLFLSCAQDIANLTLDKDQRAPSIYNIMKALDDGDYRAFLKQRFSIWNIQTNESDPEIIEAIKRIELREQSERAAQFDEIFAGLQDTWNRISTSHFATAFVTIRCKVTAHTEIRQVADKYQTIDIRTLGLKWSDMKTAIFEMQLAVEDISLIVRNAGFAWEMLDEQLSNASRDFWLPSPS